MLHTHDQTKPVSRAFITLVSMLALMAFNVQPLWAQEDPGKPDRPEKLFSSEETLNVNMTGPWREIQRNAGIPAALSRESSNTGTTRANRFPWM